MRLHHEDRDSRFSPDAKSDCSVHSREYIASEEKTWGTRSYALVEVQRSPLVSTAFHLKTSSGPSGQLTKNEKQISVIGHLLAATGQYQ